MFFTVLLPLSLMPCRNTYLLTHGVSTLQYIGFLNWCCLVLTEQGSFVCCLPSHYMTLAPLSFSRNAHRYGNGEYDTDFRLLAQQYPSFAQHVTTARKSPSHHTSGDKKVGFHCVLCVCVFLRSFFLSSSFPSFLPSIPSRVPSPSFFYVPSILPSFLHPFPFLPSFFSFFLSPSLSLLRHQLIGKTLRQ